MVGTARPKPHCARTWKLDLAEDHLHAKWPWRGCGRAYDSWPTDDGLRQENVRPREVLCRRDHGIQHSKEAAGEHDLDGNSSLQAHVRGPDTFPGYISGRWAPAVALDLPQ